jgi:hypothetical protein
MDLLTNAGPAARGAGAGRGCLGCLGRLILSLFLGIILVFAMHVVLTPWAFFLGGKFHVIPYWQGWGRMHSKTSGDYVLFVRFEPSFRRGGTMRPGSPLTGVGYLCSPRGEHFRLNLGGRMKLHLNRSTDGEAINLYMDYWPALYGQFITEHRPSLGLRGHWQNPNLVMDDHGSLSNAFLPDGSVYLGHDRNRPYSTEIVPITLKPGSYSDFTAACKSSHQ